MLASVDLRQRREGPGTHRDTGAAARCWLAGAPAAVRARRKLKVSAAHGSRESSARAQVRIIQGARSVRAVFRQPLAGLENIRSEIILSVCVCGRGSGGRGFGGRTFPAARAQRHTAHRGCGPVTGARPMVLAWLAGAWLPGGGVVPWRALELNQTAPANRSAPGASGSSLD